MMPKAYINTMVPRKKKGEEQWTDFTFTGNAEKAAYWDTEHSARLDSNYIGTLNVKITSPDGSQHHVAKDFAVEELARDKFVVFCEVPWSPQVEK
jgi:hypothetical protein